MPHCSAGFERLDEYIGMAMQRQRTPALTLALFDRKETAYSAHYGAADLATQAPIKADTLFGIGSITKSFTAAAMMQAVEEGLVDLTALVATYLPWFRVRTRYEPITVHHLLSHTSGLVGVVDRSPDPRGAVWALRDTETAWPPGAHFAYSDAGYQTLALILEQVSGQPFPQLIRDRIFEPLRMTASEPAITHAARQRAATGYASIYDDRPSHSDQPLVPAPWIETDAGDCCILSTAGDLACFGRMLLNQGDDGRVLSPEGFRHLTDKSNDTRMGFSYGYGLEIHDTADGLLLGHAGGIPGYEAYLLADVTNGVGVALLSTTPSVGKRMLANTALRLWRAGYMGWSTAGIDLSPPEPLLVERAKDFEGEYRSGTKTLTFVAEGERLMLHTKQRPVALEKRGADVFYANHPDFDRFLLRFGRDEGSSVTDLSYGPEWYHAASYQGPTALDYPAEWERYVGHYRSHNPWQTNFRVILRQGRLWLVLAGGEEDSLIHLEEDTFRIGDELSPERLTFAQFAGDHALCVNLSGTDYYRFFTA